VTGDEDRAAGAFEQPAFAVTSDASNNAGAHLASTRQQVRTETLGAMSG